MACKFGFFISLRKKQTYSKLSFSKNLFIACGCQIYLTFITLIWPWSMWCDRCISSGCSLILDRLLRYGVTNWNARLLWRNCINWDSRLLHCGLITLNSRLTRRSLINWDSRLLIRVHWLTSGRILSGNSSLIYWHLGHLTSHIKYNIDTACIYGRTRHGVLTYILSLFFPKGFI